MTITKKIVLAAIAFTFVVLFYKCAVLLDRLGDDLCTTTVLAQYPSPSRKLKAVLFQIDCGATSDFNSQLAIIPTESDPTKKDVLPQSFFAADCNNGRAPAGLGKGPELRVLWKSEELLEVQYHKQVRIIRDKSKSNGVSIAYRKFR